METTQKQPRRFLALLDKKAALAAASLLTAEQPGIRYAFSVAIDSSHWDAAHAVGLSRTLIKKIRGRQAWEGRGADDERIDTEGALAEILMALLLEKAGAVIAPLVAHKPDSSGVDITLDGKQLDVKSSGQGRTLVNINQQTHERKNATEAYILVRFTRSDVADVYVVSYATVQKPAWQHVTFIRGQALDPHRYYFSCKMPSAGLLEDLPEETEA